MYALEYSQLTMAARTAYALLLFSGLFPTQLSEHSMSFLNHGESTHLLLYLLYVNQVGA